MPPTVLIVDDDPSLTVGVAVRLQASGYTVLAADDVPSGISRALNDKPDLIVLDLGLPGGGGMSALERFRRDETTKDTPILVVSARQKSEGEAAVEAGANAFLQKPVENQRLLAAISDLLAG